MTINKGNTAIIALAVAMVAMVISLYVPHHHHEESICIGNYDCRDDKSHSHQDECGGQGDKDVCCFGLYVDTKDSSVNHPNDSSSKLHATLIHNQAIEGFSYESLQLAVFLLRPHVALPLRANILRGPPTC